jgi:hypothetical protein
VVKEVQAVTRETETIKAQIGSDLWTRQRVWERKREIYSQLLKNSTTLRDALIDYMGQVTLTVALTTAGKDTTDYEPKDLVIKRNSVTEALRRFLDLFQEAYIFLIPKACSTLSEFVNRYGTIVQNLNDGQDCTNALLILTKAVKEITEAAKEDLGVTSHG